MKTIKVIKTSPKKLRRRAAGGALDFSLLSASGCFLLPVSWECEGMQAPVAINPPVPHEPQHILPLSCHIIRCAVIATRNTTYTMISHIVVNVHGIYMFYMNFFVVWFPETGSRTIAQTILELEAIILPKTGTQVLKLQV